MMIAMSQIRDVPPALPDTIEPAVVDLVMDCLAKKASMRPATALELAQRAEKLGGKTPVGQFNTRIIETVKPIPQTTTIIETVETKGEKPAAIWPWVSAITVVVLTTVGVVLAVMTQPAPTPTPTPTPTETPTPTPTPTPTETPTTPSSTTVFASDVMEQNVDVVEALLIGKGLRVNRVEGTALPTGDPRINTVYEATPLGSLPVDTTVKVTYYIEDTSQTAPTN
jgi:serine/threonine-protein kinase